MLHMIIQGFIDISTFTNLLWIVFGTLTGILIGAIPGLTATMGIALLLPLTFGMAPLPSLSMLLGIYAGGMYGGSITAILINTPGTPAAAATSLDGYPLAQKGEAGRALKMAIYSSTVGGLFSAFMLLLIAPQLAKLALKFGPAEYTALVLLGLTVIAGISGNSLLKGLIAGSLGLLLSTIGLDPMLGMPRLTFNSMYLTGGLSTVPVLIGLFAISEILMNSENIGVEGNKMELAKISGDQKVTFKEFRSHFWTMIKGSLIGTYIGIIPGIGSGVAAFVSYNEAKRVSKHPENFGKGEMAGVVASESANNGATGATLIPLLTLGIPGDVVTAVLLGAFMIQGLTPGPLLFRDHGSTIYAIIAGFFIINIVMMIFGILGVKYFAHVNSLPAELLYTVIFVMCAIGSFAVDNSLFNVGVVLAFGLVGYVFRKLELPGGPFLIAFLLGPLFESNLRRTVILFDGNMMLMFTKPIAVFFLVLCAVSLFFILKNNKKHAVK